MSSAAAVGAEVGACAHAAAHTSVNMIVTNVFARYAELATRNPVLTIRRFSTKACIGNPEILI
jgi:hypothetical protein